MAASTAESGLGNPLSFLNASPAAGGAAPQQQQFAQLLGVNGTPPLISDEAVAAASGKGTTEKGVGKHYWPVELHRPVGASAGLKAVIQLAETAIQTAVDLLGRGTPVPPPKVDDLLKPAVYEELGEGEAAEDYAEAFKKVQTRQKALVGLDDEVVKAAIVVAEGKDETLAAIKKIVAALNSKLDAVTAKKLKPAEEQALMKLISRAVEAVYKLVNAAADVNEAVAGGSEGAAAGAGQAGGGAAGGDGMGGLASLLPMLAMIPMGLMSAAPAVINAVQQHNEKQQEQAEKAAAAGAPGGPPPADPNAAPGAPNTALAAAPPGDPTAPGAAQPAGAPAPAAGENHTTGAAVLPGGVPLRPRRDRPAGNNPTADGNEAQTAEHVEVTHDAPETGAQIIT
ncbi:hypothetical protein [Nocardia blacklockiae]|uniref:hypothetical protein n=1 Tax=Nocardia blacklockiae TaxID=480036 RepID=UPI001894DF2C|nr:hypothetical protein [Nocardia blacklockiae]MBF6175647.1 hypothetical protein [Nocardia blacklockiae]